jgi:membrane protein implicated in regulation of membrane protease activity
MCHILLLLPVFALPLFWVLPREEALIVYAVVCFFSAAFYWLVWQTMHRPAATGIEGMIGGIGTIFRCGEGQTKVLYRGEIWDAVCNDGISLGERVEIIGFDRMKLVVRRRV